MKYNQLRLVMQGSHCNLRCAYCVAGYTHRTPDDTAQSLDEVEILAAIGADAFSSISIWGGEPFYNFSALQETLDFCTKHFPGLPVIVISNGTAFSPEKVDFIHSRNISVTLSHDANSQFFRGPDFLAVPEQLELIKAIDAVAFTTVIHNYNCDIPAIFKYFEGVACRLGKDIRWMFELFQLSSPAAIRFLPQGKSLVEYANSLDFVLQEYVKGHPFAISALSKNLFGMASLMDGDYVARCRCGAHNRLTITTRGRKAFCQVQAENGNFRFPELALPPMCADCNVARFCAGICPNLTDGYRKKMCVIYKLFYTKLYGFLLKLQQDAIEVENGQPA